MSVVRPASLAVALLIAFAASAWAGGPALSDGVVAALRGKIVISRAAVAAGANDKETTAKLKAAQLMEVVGKPTDDGEEWRFHYTAFLKKTGNVALKLRFVSGEQDRRQAAETSVSIVDVQSPVLSGDVVVGERQGLERGKAYLVQLVNDKGELVAKTSALFK
ncbi:MAG TPA: hypothetical protein VHJ20_16230 [Polyangia bacterium]|nr:hypothetical protein [Polyangia bacterium]